MLVEEEVREKPDDDAGSDTTKKAKQVNKERDRDDSGRVRVTMLCCLLAVRPLTRMGGWPGVLRLVCGRCALVDWAGASLSD